jgi:drug/metabolite transporter (DMT)-like permease
LLGILYAAVGAFTFALNNATIRRGVVSGSVLQAMALTVPIGGLSFLAMTIAFGDLGQLVVIPTVAMFWLASQGIVHFIIGRYFNYKANQLMGVNLAAPVVQLQVPFSMIMAVAALHEAFTVLQAIGTVLMLGGSFTTQTKVNQPNRATAPLSAAVAAPAVPARERPAESAFKPQVFWGCIFAVGAAAFYGASPLLAREAFLRAPGISTTAAGCLAYGVAMLVFACALLKPGAWRDIRSMKTDNLLWFLAAAVLVAISQALVYAALAIAPLMVVQPILQLSLVFRLLLSQLINRDHEVMNTAVLIGSFTAVLGSLLVSLDTNEVTGFLGLPAPLAAFLGYRLAGG